MVKNNISSPWLDDQLVSVITPAYNAERFLQETIQSVISQTYDQWEMIIVDDGSTDSTYSLAESWSGKDSRIRVIKCRENGGQARAWNIAIAAAKGRYLAFLDADDLWVENKLEEQLAFMKENNYGFTYTMYDWIDENSGSAGKIIDVPESQSYKDMLKNTAIGALTVVIDRSLVDVAEIPEVHLNDSMMWLQIAREGVTAYGYDKVLAHYRIVTNSFSRNKKRSAVRLWNLYRDQLKIPFFRRAYYFTCYAFNSIKRYYLK